MVETIRCRIEKDLLDKYKEAHPTETKRMTYTGIANYIIEQFVKLEEEIENE